MPDYVSSTNALVDKIVKLPAGHQKIDLATCLDLCEMIKLRSGNARIALDRIIHHVNGFDDRRAFFALNLLEVIMLNGGFPVRFLVSRKDFLNSLVSRFPAVARKKPDPIEDYICLLLSKWSKSLGVKSKYKEEYANFHLMSDLLASKGTSLTVFTNCK